jgi:ElaB/YqjD/DUF883 family membrane-anchored ribosome-binding protein
MGQDPEVIRHQIEQTRENMGETVDALGYKTDVKSRARDSVSEKTDALRSKFSGASDSAPSTGDVKQGAKQAAGVAQENPIGLALAGVAVGFVAGMLVPSTRVEDEKIGDLSDQVMDKVKETGGEALDRGKQVAQEAAQSAKETAQESGSEHAEELRSSAQDKAQEARPTY